MRLCEQAGITLAVNQNMRYDQSVRAGKPLLENGTLGAPVFAQPAQPAAPAQPKSDEIDMSTAPAASVAVTWAKSGCSWCSLERIFRAWAHQITSIGCEVKGQWLVDWDMGDGYYCWRFPEQAISFFHTYDEGFAGRIPIN